MLRPDFNAAVTALVRHIATTMPDFAHIEPARIVVVLGEARRASRATVKPYAFKKGARRDGFGRTKPLVRIAGVRVLYCITLRPLFFRASTPRARVATVLHELFHISRRFDGTLDRSRRHARLGAKFDDRLRPLEKRLWSELPLGLKLLFAHDGEVKVLQWLERPTAWLPNERVSKRIVYTERHLFPGIVRMKTKIK
jgi:hypothetical protein